MKGFLNTPKLQLLGGISRPANPGDDKWGTVRERRLRTVIEMTRV